jgi:hypothetical protein
LVKQAEEETRKLQKEALKQIRDTTLENGKAPESDEIPAEVIKADNY